MSLVITVECSPNCDISNGLKAGTINGKEGKDLTFNYTIDVANFKSFGLIYNSKTILKADPNLTFPSPNLLFDFNNTVLVKDGANKYSFTFKLIKLNMMQHNTKFYYSLKYGIREETGMLTINVQGKIFCLSIVETIF